MDFGRKIGELKDNVASLREQDPETFLARIAIITEGVTEFGFVEHLLERAIKGDRLNLGVWITDAGGNDRILSLLEGLAGSGLRFAGFADDEGRSKTKWARVQKELGSLLFRWPSGCLEENIITLVPDDQLEEFVKDKEGDSGVRLRTLADRLDIKEKDLSTIRTKTNDLKALIIQAASGVVPDDKTTAEKPVKKALKNHGQQWFKTIEGGHELAAKVFQFGLWPKLKDQLLPFLNAIRLAVSLPEITELPQSEITELPQ